MSKKNTARSGKKKSLQAIESLMEQLENEMRCKNMAYAFILSYGLLDLFTDFCNKHDGIDGHKFCIDYLCSHIRMADTQTDTQK